MVLMEKAISIARQESISDHLRNPGECSIKIIGVGGCGNNTVNRLMKQGVTGAECIAINTDVQHLDIIEADKKILMGHRTTRGLGAGNMPYVGREAMRESAHQVERLVNDSDIVFVAAGLGGGTGTGAAPIVADICRERGAIVVGIVTMPFRHEKGRYELALKGLADMKMATHTTVIIDNNKLMDLVPQLPIESAFTMADSTLANMVKGIIETIANPSMINLDFADFKTIMTKGEVAIVGMGQSDAPDRAEVAATQALNHMMLDVDYHGSNGALIHVTGGPDMTLGEAVRAAEIITDKMSDDSMVIWGSRIDPDLGKQMRVTLVLTGIDSPRLVGGDYLDDLKLYNMDPNTGQEKNVDLGIELFDIESSWK